MKVEMANLTRRVTAGSYIENMQNTMLSYRRETVLQSSLVLTKSGRLKLGANILRT